MSERVTPKTEKRDPMPVAYLYPKCDCKQPHCPGSHARLAHIFYPTSVAGAFSGMQLLLGNN